MRCKVVSFTFFGLIFGAMFFVSCIINQPRYCADFNDLSLDERKETVRKNSIETNFALIRCSYYTEGGPEIADVPIIEGGQSSVPFLLSKLDSEDEHEQATAISLIFRIDIREKLQNRNEILDKIEKTVNSMKNEINKRYSLERLNEMKEKNDKNPQK